MTKTAQLAATLVAGRSVTRATALVAFKIANITAEIATLRARGYRITTEILPDDGTGAQYTRWTFAGTTRKGSDAEAEVRALRSASRRARAANLAGRRDGGSNASKPTV